MPALPGGALPERTFTAKRRTTMSAPVVVDTAATLVNLLAERSNAFDGG